MPAQSFPPDGMLLVNKEPGWTSFDVAAKLRGILHTRKVGHTGTLDPEAGGVLPILYGRGTRLAELFADHDKAYRAVLRLGVVTDSQDMTGQVLSVCDLLDSRLYEMHAALETVAPGGFTERIWALDNRQLYKE